MILKTKAATVHFLCNNDYSREKRLSQYINSQKMAKETPREELSRFCVQYIQKREGIFVIYEAKCRLIVEQGCVNVILNLSEFDNG